MRLMQTTIQVSGEIRDTLERMKIYKRERERESYNEVIERMIEDNLELNEKTKKEIEEAKKRIDQGKFLTMEEVAKKYGV